MTVLQKLYQAWLVRDLTPEDWREALEAREGAVNRRLRGFVEKIAEDGTYGDPEGWRAEAAALLTSLPKAETTRTNRRTANPK